MECFTYLRIEPIMSLWWRAKLRVGTMVHGQRATLSNRSMDMDRARGFCVIWQGPRAFTRSQHWNRGARWG